MDHSFLPPSGASAWSKCALWATMNQRYPQDESPAALEGTAAHWVAWEMLNAQSDVEMPQEGSSTPNKLTVTGEMLDGGELLIETIQARLAVCGAGSGPFIEQQISIPSLGENCFGTPDCWGWNPATKHIEIIDYKFGHRFVDEYFNPQGLLYLFGILSKINPAWSFQEQISVSFTVVQPRCYYKGSPVRTHSFWLKDAGPYFQQFQIMAGAALASQPTATTNPHCCDCSGRHACPTLQQAAYSDAEFATDRQPYDLSPQAAALELKMLERASDRLQARVEGLRELTIANLKTGVSIPHYHLEPSSGRARWNLPNDQIISIGQLLGKDLSKTEVITPAQAKKLGVDESVIKAYSQNNSSLKLIADNPADARRVFGSIGE